MRELVANEVIDVSGGTFQFEAVLGPCGGCSPIYDEMMANFYAGLRAQERLLYPNL